MNQMFPRRSPASRRHWSARGSTAATLLALASAVMAAPPPPKTPPTTAIPGCGALNEGYGPWDYRKDRGEPLRLVEGAHFTQQVEMLVRGVTSVVIGQDIDYTLRAFPNHHRALLSAARLAARQKTDPPAGMRHSVDCWFQRAVVWQPDDHVARMLYAQWLGQNKRRDDALRHLKFIESIIEPEDALTRYNLGLVYLELQQYESSAEMARQAAALGDVRADLRNKLAALGKWSEPAAPAAPASSPTPAAPASAPQ